MNGETPHDNQPMPDEDYHAGEQIEALRELEHPASPLFLKSVRRKIHRRATASQFLSFSWQLPKIAFLEMGSMLAHILNAVNHRKGD